jgi:hypothetical protein
LLTTRCSDLRSPRWAEATIVDGFDIPLEDHDIIAAWEVDRDSRIGCQISTRAAGWSDMEIQGIMDPNTPYRDYVRKTRWFYRTDPEVASLDHSINDVFPW